MKPTTATPVGGNGRTLDEARRFLLDQPAGFDHKPGVQLAAELLLAAAEDGTPRAITAATDQLERALFLTYRLSVEPLPRGGGKGPAPSRRRSR